jgi:hypothetical protein
LLEQLDLAKDSSKPIQAWVSLKPADSSQEAASPEETQSLAQPLVQWVKDRVGQGTDSVNVFQNLGAFIVSAHPEFVRELIHQQKLSRLNQPMLRLD